MTITIHLILCQEVFAGNAFLKSGKKGLPSLCYTLLHPNVDCLQWLLICGPFCLLESEIGLRSVDSISYRCLKKLFHQLNCMFLVIIHLYLEALSYQHHLFESEHSLCMHQSSSCCLCALIINKLRWPSSTDSHACRCYNTICMTFDMRCGLRWIMSPFSLRDL